MAHDSGESSSQPNGELAADSLHLQQKGMPRGRPWQPGESGNPKGKVIGTRNISTRFAQALLDHNLEDLVQTTIDRALNGDPMALKLCVERILAPQRQTRVSFVLPPLKTAADAAAALAAIAAATADGELAPAEARDLTGTVDAFVHALEAQEFERRLTELEAIDAKYERAL